MWKYLLIVLTFVTLTGLVFAAEEKSKAPTDREKAVKLVKDAIKFYKEKGKDVAFKEFNNPKGKFTDGEFYIFVMDFKNITLSHGGNEKLIGKDFSDMKDANGVYFLKEMTKVAKEKGSGWVEYRWANPVTKKVEAKETYVERVEGEEVYMGCGIYKK